MILASILIMVGILIALYPELLSFIVASLFILSGLAILFIRYNLRKSARNWRNPFLDFFIRF